MMRLDEHVLELVHALERRLDRDDERERFDGRRQRVSLKPTYSRFRTLARIADQLDANLTAASADAANSGKRAA